MNFFRKFHHYLKQKRDDFALYTIDVIYDRRQGGWARFYGGLLQGCSYLFNGIVQLRLFLYKNRILRNQPLGCLVVAVGNLTVGGTGKTPVVECFARTLQARGRRVAILSRGYKSKGEPLYKTFWRFLTHSEPPPPRVVSDGKEILLDSESAGDEPYMLAKNLPGVPVIVDKNRVKAGQFAIKNFQSDTLILDDGFQYMALKGRLNLLLIDLTNPFGNHRVLPRGILREPIKHLRRASYILLTKSEGVTNPELEQLIKKQHPNVEIIECAHKPRYLQAFNSDERRDLNYLDGRRIGVFSGIATPESFEALLRESGAILTQKRRFLDHHRFSVEDLESFFKAAKAAQLTMVVTTEKDSVRIPKDFVSPLPLYYMRVEIEILRGAKDFEEAVEHICLNQQFAVRQ